MSRLFTFGCSFTHYHWPTWADIIGQEFDYYENWGQGGQGNHFIFNSLNECAIKNNINSNDTVIIMWSDIYREDIYNNKEWKSDNDNKYQFNKNDPRGYLIKNLGFINSTKIMLDHFGCNYYFLSLVPVDKDPGFWGQSREIPNDTISDSDIRDHYKSCLEIIKPSIYETVFNSNWNSRTFVPKNYPNTARNRIDFHASTAEHLEYLDAVLPVIPLSDNTRAWVNEVQEHLTQDPAGQDPFNMSNYRPWVWTLPPLWTWQKVKRL
jgi:hypothetical protein